MSCVATAAFFNRIGQKRTSLDYSIAHGGSASSKRLGLFQIIFTRTAS